MRAVLVLVLVLVMGCGGASPTARASTPEAPASSAPLVARMVITPCFGRCLAYEAQLRADGDLVLARNGAEPRRTRLDRATMDAVTAAFAQARFFELDEAGFSPASSPTPPTGPTRSGPGGTTTYDFVGRVVCSDTSRTLVTYVDGDRERTIGTDHCEPSELTRLEDRLSELFAIERWLRSLVQLPGSP